MSKQKTFQLNGKHLMIGLIVLILIASGVTAWNNNMSEREPKTVSLVPEIDPNRKINGINVLYYHPELDNLEEYTADFVARLADLGTTDIAIAIPLFMDNQSSSDVIKTSETPSVDEIRLLITESRIAGIRPIIKPLIDSPENPDFLRQAIEPTQINPWFESYFLAIKPYIELSQQEALESFVLGVELSSMQQYSDQWTQLSERTREIYKGQLTYAANWDATDIPFSASLDYVGVDAYYPYEGSVNNTDLKRFWNQTLDSIESSSSDGFLAHEYGIPSEVGAQRNPWSEDPSNIASEELQDIWLRAACDVLHERTRGGYIWVVYFGIELEGPLVDEKGYNIIGKPLVEQSVSDCFSWY